MGIGAVDLAGFTIPFVYAGGDVFDYGTRFAAIRDALDLDPRCEPRYRGAGMSHVGAFAGGRSYQGAIRINGLHKRKVGAARVESVSYSVVIRDGDEILGWSGDLDASYPTKPSDLWFTLDGVELPMTDALRAAIKALVPKKARVPKPGA